MRDATSHIDYCSSFIFNDILSFITEAHNGNRAQAQHSLAPVVLKAQVSERTKRSRNMTNTSYEPAQPGVKQVELVVEPAAQVFV